MRDALSVYLVNELYDNVDVSSALAQELPPALKGLAPTAAGALRQPATDAVDRLLDAPHVQQLFIDASSLAQSKLVNVLENKTGDGISTGDGVVTLDLGEVVTQLGTDLGLPASALARIPPDAGVITVMRSDQLSARADRRAGRARAQRAAAGARAGVVRARDLPGPRCAPRDAAQHRLGARAGRADRARRAPGRRQRGRRRAHHADLTRRRPPGVADRHRDPGRHRLGRDPVRRLSPCSARCWPARAGPRRPCAAGSRPCSTTGRASRGRSSPSSSCWRSSGAARTRSARHGASRCSARCWRRACSRSGIRRSTRLGIRSRPDRCNRGAFNLWGVG